MSLVLLTVGVLVILLAAAFALFRTSPAVAYDLHVRSCGRCIDSHQKRRAGLPSDVTFPLLCPRGKLLHLRWSASQGEVSAEMLARGERVYGAQIKAEEQP